MRQVALLQRAGVRPLCVFDGGPLPSKRAEEDSRAARRLEQLERAREHLRRGNGGAAQECFQRAADVTPAMAARVCAALRRAGVPYVVAPYEADAQCAHLAASGAVAAVLTEDSDLLAYGVARCLFKLREGSVEEVACLRLPACRELNLVGFDPHLFLQMCVLAGCDYLPSVPGVGVKRAHALVRRFRSAAAAVRHLRFEGAAVPAGYEAGLADALLTFAHHWVWDARAGEMVHRTPPPPGVDADKLAALLGPRHPPELARGIAEARVCPLTLLPFAEAAGAMAPPPGPAARAPAPQAQAQPQPRIASYFSRLPLPAFGEAAGPPPPPPRPSKRVQKAAAAATTTAAAAAAAASAALVASILAEDGAGGAGPAAGPAVPRLSIFEDVVSAEPSTSAGSPSASADPSPARAWAGALRSQPPNLACLQPQPPRALDAGARKRVSSRFFSAEAAAPAAAPPDEAAPGAASAPAALAADAPPRLSVDLRHLRRDSEVAEASMRGLDSYRRSGSGAAPSPSPARSARKRPAPLESFAYTKPR